jgi:RNA polymerase sigma-70 factor (ECF subfamily)
MRRRVQGSVPDADDLQQQQRVVDAFLAAAREGDFEADHCARSDMVLRADRGVLPGASRFVRGAQKLVNGRQRTPRSRCCWKPSDGTAPGMLLNIRPTSAAAA